MDTIGTLLVATIAIAAIASALLTLREHRRIEWLQRRVWLRGRQAS